jgi:hypothetical protein
MAKFFGDIGSKEQALLRGNVISVSFVLLSAIAAGMVLLSV